MGLLGSVNDYIVTSLVYRIFLERAGRRPANVFSVEVVLAIVTSAPNLFGVGAVLNYAVEMSTNSGESL